MAISSIVVVWTSVALLAVAPLCHAQSEDTVQAQKTIDEKLLHKYVWSTLGPVGIFGAALAAGFDHWRDDPAPWGQQWDGYAKRWVSQYAESAIGSTTKYAVARMAHLDPSFRRCRCRGVPARLRHAVVSPFIAYRPDGEAVPSFATVAGILAQNVVPAATWYPEFRGVRGGLEHAGSGVLAKTGIDVYREFAPRRLILWGHPHDAAGNPTEKRSDGAGVRGEALQVPR